MATTHEPEITAPVDLCTPDGATLATAARGWSRRPLHRANLGPHPQNKRWDYWCVMSGDLIVSWVYADVEAIGLADVYWHDIADGATGGGSVLTEPGVVTLPDVVGAAPLVVDREEFAMDVRDDATGTRLRASWTEADGRPGRIDVRMERPDDLESLNVVIPWSDEIFNFTSKQWLRAASGELVVGDRAWTIDGWSALDVGRGRWPREIRWNWGGGGGRVDGRLVGLQFGAKWTEGTGFTENGFVLDGRLTKLGDELEWTYDWDRPMEPWRVRDPHGRLDVTLAPRFDKHSGADAGGQYGSETHQVFGTWSGHVRTEDGEEVRVEGLPGFAEEARQRW
ncbi:DUF2804 domain-containing protein [Actinomarinicola tropica]|uniref:DUF2804 family protein n=1 Tax=Actinomarinicola tropica TaxID=2789776 RepID=A0A5Q2RDE9_9ACTN|nr:DUF2804 domain-containing protein [Actinomarinicola tropica]QGG93683.1 DUF2804 family protein [Actinomarinicola tropica]